MADTSSSSSSPKLTLYFGYGSNLWLEQMATRCPHSHYLGIARLPNYTWLINDRGYANVVESSNSSSSEADYKNCVYGMVYSLTRSDEARLDVNEGVPVAYTKEYLSCDFWSAASEKHKVDTSLPPTETSKPLLVYIDRQRTSPSTPREEYVYRMNRGIHDALECGMPEEYVKEVMRAYIPSDDNDEDGDKDGKKKEEREKMAEFARGQAARFRDESGVIE